MWPQKRGRAVCCWMCPLVPLLPSTPLHTCFSYRPTHLLEHSRTRLITTAGTLSYLLVFMLHLCLATYLSVIRHTQLAPQVLCSPIGTPSSLSPGLIVTNSYIMLLNYIVYIIFVLSVSFPDSHCLFQHIFQYPCFSKCVPLSLFTYIESAWGFKKTRKQKPMNHPRLVICDWWKSTSCQAQQFAKAQMYLQYPSGFYLLLCVLWYDLDVC